LVITTTTQQPNPNRGHAESHPGDVGLVEPVISPASFLRDRKNCAFAAVPANPARRRGTSMGMQRNGECWLSKTVKFYAFKTRLSRGVSLDRLTRERRPRLKLPAVASVIILKMPVNRFRGTAAAALWLFNTFAPILISFSLTLVSNQFSLVSNLFLIRSGVTTSVQGKLLRL